MPKRIEINRDKFIDAYQAKNDCGGHLYTISKLAKIFKMSDESVNVYRKKFGLVRNLKKCKGCQHPFEVCICGGVAHG